MLEGKAVLIVDDEIALLEMYVERFKAEGAQVLIARNGREAIDQALASHPNLILLDIMMPGINGFEVLKALKADETTRDIPVMVFTVLLESDKYNKAKNLGAIDYIVKSETMPAEVVEKAKNILVPESQETKDVRGTF